MSPRHAQPSRWRRILRWPVVTAVVVVLALAAGAFVAYQKWWSQPSNTAAGTTSAAPTFNVPAPTAAANKAAALPVDAPAAQNGAAPCTQVRVLSSLENADVLQAAATAYAAKPRDVGGVCVQIAVTAGASGPSASAAAQGFPAQGDPDKPTLWIPDSSVWLGPATVGSKGFVDPSTATTVAQTGIVVAMPKKMAQATSWQASAPSWKQVFATAADADYWKSNGHPEWGPFKFAKTSPQVASSGLFGLMASYGAATGNQTSFTVNQVNSPATVKKVAAAELTISHYMTTPEQFLVRARQADSQGAISGFLSAVIVDEKSVWDYNRGVSSVDGVTTTVEAPPTEKLVPIYPSEGVYVAKSSAVVLSGPWVAEAQKAAAADFVTFLTTQEGQDVVRKNGYRDILGSADSAVASVGTLRSTLKPIKEPAPAVAVAVRNSFDSVRKRARILFLIDVSGSMADPVSAGGPTKLAGAQSAINGALDYFTADDEVGLAAFSNNENQPITPGLVTAVGPLAQNAAAIKASLASLAPISQTPLYAAVTGFAADMANAYEPDRINAIVLLSDGRNETSLPGQLTDLTAALSADTTTTPVLVFALAYGADADAPSLQSITKASGGQYYDATNASTLNTVLADLVTSF